MIETGGTLAEAEILKAAIESLRQVESPAERLAALAKISNQASSQNRDDIVAAVHAIEVQVQSSPKFDATAGVEELITLAAAVSSTNPDSDPNAYSISDDPELIGDFLMESRDHLAAVEQGLLQLERDPSHSESIHATFRSFHTIKGLSGFLGFVAVQEIAHETETLLDLARSGSLAITAPLIDVILRSADYLKSALNKIERSPRDLEKHAPADLMEAVIRASRGDSAPVVSALSKEPQREPQATPQEAALELLTPAPEAAANPTDAAPASPEKAGSASSIKVDSEKIEYLIDMVGELVIAQSMVRQHPSLGTAVDPVLARSLAHLSRVTSEVQKTAMSMRMAPVSSLFQKMSRVVRDIARKSGKKVALQMSGDDAEMDRKILDGLAEPMLHMVRNAVDHGLEGPPERLKNGKDASGVIRLRAERESGNIVIEIADDGRGLDTARIRTKAIERGLISESAKLSPEDIHKLIFEPGFSTAEKLTEFSGRGVGMDVVRRQVEYLRGRVEIRSVFGKGSTFTVRVPLTLATVDGLLIRVGTERYILPTFVVREIFREGDRPVSTITGLSEVVEFRKTTIPVVRLRDRLRTASMAPSQTGVMVVVQTGEKRVCLVVDEVIGKQEVVIKSLGAVFRNQPGIAGGAILGDGRVGLILDLDDLLQTRFGA